MLKRQKKYLTFSNIYFKIFRTMIRINTAPLGMQNLLSGNRKLYLTSVCVSLFNNGNNKLVRDNNTEEEDVDSLGFPIEPPFVMASYDGSKIMYSDNAVSISIYNEKIANGINMDLINYCPQNQETLKSLNVAINEKKEIKVNVPKNNNVNSSNFMLKLAVNESIGQPVLKDQNNNTIDLNDYGINIENYLSLDRKEFYFTSLVYAFDSKNTGRKIKQINIAYKDR